jgi:hypothetical protein
VNENPLERTIRAIIAAAHEEWNEGKGLAAEEPPTDFVAERVAAHFRQVGLRAQDGSLEERFNEPGYSDSFYWQPVFVVVPTTGEA